jgi:hypothetical protein
MRFVLSLLVLCTSLVHARTPIDTIAMERSDSGSRYVKIHAAYPREQLRCLAYPEASSADLY